MSKSKPPKKVVVTTTKSAETKRPMPTTATRSTRTRTAATAPKVKSEMIFGRQNYIWMGIGVGLITIGLFMMAGGAMPSPDVWEPGRIYSFTRITLAPILIIAGLAVEIYAVFIRNEVVKSDTEKKDLV
jgi:hypothetical protein